MSRTIPLTRGYVTVVDDADYEWLNQHRWFAQSSYKSTIYAAREEKVNGRWKRVLMHREILGIASKPSSVKADHVNRDALDNRRSNLRVCTNQQNAGNYGAFESRRGKPCSSRYRGVSYYGRHGYWTAQIHKNGKKHHLGCYDTQEEAARARDKASLEHFGEFAYLNLPPE